MNGPGLDGLGRIILVTGVILAALGLAVMLGGKIGLGRLPGDIIIRRGNFTFYFPLVTGILLSLIITLVLSLLRRP
jgi:hypothetical protein